MKNKNAKNIIIIIIILLMIIGFWLLTLKLNLQNGFKNSLHTNGLTFDEFRQEVGQILAESPLLNKKDTHQELNNLVKKVTEQIKSTANFNIPTTTPEIENP